MELFREIRKVEANDFVMHLPDDFINKDVEIVIRKINNKGKHNRQKKAPEFSALKLNTKGFKFNREEANER